MDAMRWSPGFLCGGSEFGPFWQSLAEEKKPRRRSLLIGGRGFDPRTTIGPSAIARAGFSIEEYVLIRLTNPHDNPDRPRNQEAANNEATLRELFTEGNFRIEEIAGRQNSGRLTGSANVRTLLTEQDWLSRFTDIIVDITALPTSVSFPLLGGLIARSDGLQNEGSGPFNLHCIVCENADLDEQIVAEGGDTADYIDPFRGRGSLAAEPDPITIWAPILGERQNASLEKIHGMLRPMEVKPFLPSPSRNPRRGDELVAEYHRLLFDGWEVEPRGFIYADERDPFDIYRQLGDLAQDYTEALKPLGTAKVVVSAHSSKLLSLGVLLAAFDHNLAIAHVEPTGYKLDGARVDQEANELFEVWLTGDAYVA